MQRLVVVSLLVVLAVLVEPSPARAAPVPGIGCQIFPANNVWNMDVSGLPVHPRSHPDFGSASYG